MDDIREEEYGKQLKKRATVSKYLFILNNNYKKVILMVLILFILFFPETIGNICGTWYNKLHTAFLNNIN